MYIQHNMAAEATNRFLKENTRTKLKCLEKLSSGYKINRAADNAAGQAVSEKMRAQIRGLNQGERNIEDGIGFVQTADGALSEVQSMMHRMREIAVQAANDTNTTDDRKALDMELQQYKKQINDIFEETEFNTIKIWDTNTNNRVQIGVEPRQALRFVGSSSGSQQIKITEANKGAVAFAGVSYSSYASTSSGYSIEVQGIDETDASTYGFRVKWEGYNKKQYTSELISWNASDIKSFSVNLRDYLDTATYPELKGIDFKIEWNALEVATLEDVAKSVDKVQLYSSVSSSENITRRNGTLGSGITISVETNYLSELASGRSLTEYDTVWIEPEPKNASNVIEAPAYNDTQENKGWKFHFNMPNIGTVTASSYQVSYYGNDNTGPEYGWWVWSSSKPPRYHARNERYLGDGTMRGISRCFDEFGDYGLRNAETGGRVYLYFHMDSDKTYRYEDRTDNKVGSIMISIPVGSKETKADIMKKLKNALDNAVIDIDEGNKTSNSAYPPYVYAGYARANTHLIDTPVYKTNHDRVIQAGANAGQLIHICYESLRLMNLGIQNSNVLTGESATQTISEVQSASEIISGQRSLFGSYQNRMEHAKAVDAETAENLQAAESRIKDADMADEIMKNARNAILEQSMQAMLANANRRPEGVLSLLQM